MVTAPDDVRAVVAGAVFPEPGSHVPPWNDRVPCAAKMINWNPCGAGDGGRMVFGDEEVATCDGVAIWISGPVLDELREIFGGDGTVTEAFAHRAGVEGAGAANEADGGALAGGMGESHAPRPGMSDESTDEDQSLDSETRCVAGELLTFEESPRDLGGERFTKNPARGDALIKQGGFDSRCVVAQLPVGLMRVSGLDEMGAIPEILAERREEGPIPVQARQVDERGRRGGAVDAELKFFTESDS